MSKPRKIETKIRFKRARDGRKKLEEAPAPASDTPHEPVPRRARLIREGSVGSYSELARLTGTSPAWITAIMKLLDLPVPEQEETLVRPDRLAPN